MAYNRRVLPANRNLDPSVFESKDVLIGGQRALLGCCSISACSVLIIAGMFSIPSFSGIVLIWIYPYTQTSTLHSIMYLSKYKFWLLDFPSSYIDY